MDQVEINGRIMSRRRPNVDLRELPEKLIHADDKTRNGPLRLLHERFGHNSPTDMMKLLQAISNGQRDSARQQSATVPLARSGVPQGSARLTPVLRCCCSQDSRISRARTPGVPGTHGRSRALPGFLARASRMATPPRRGPKSARVAPKSHPNSPTGPRVAPRSLQDAQDGLQTAKEAPKTPQESSNSTPKSPKRRKPPNSLRETHTFSMRDFSAFTAFKTAQEAPKIAPRQPKAPRDGARGPQDGRRGAQDSPREPRDGPRRSPKGGARTDNSSLPPQDAPGKPQEAPKTAPRSPNTPPEGPKLLPKGVKTASKRPPRGLPRHPNQHPTGL